MADYNTVFVAEQYGGASMTRFEMEVHSTQVGAMEEASMFDENTYEHDEWEERDGALVAQYPGGYIQVTEKRVWTGPESIEDN